MKHAIFSAALFPLATPLWADVIPLNAPVTAATLYSEGATLTRAVPFSAPAGTHELLITNLPDSLDPQSVRVALEGATLGAVTVRHDRVLPSVQVDSAELTAAKATLEALENDLRDIEDRQGDVLRIADVARARLAYLATLKGPTEIAATPEVIAETVALVGRETLAAHRDIANAERDARKFDTEIEDLADAIEDARQTVEALTPSESETTMLAVSISAPAATDGLLTLTHLTPFAGWMPTYDIYLDEGDSAALRVERAAFIAQQTDEDWSNVAITLSTSLPDEQSQPSELFPWRRRIEDKPAVVPKTNAGRLAEMDLSEAPMVEPVVIEEMATSMFSEFDDGINATYQYPDPVTLTSDAEALRLSFGALQLAPDVFAQANPMRDETAFLIAEAKNETGELILPSEIANFYLNGTFVGQREMPLVAVGDIIETSFGPINGLRLSDTITSRVSGDKGVLTTRNEQSETRLLTAENLTDRDWALRLVGRVPYSEQQDLIITHQATPTPTHTNYEDQRGILMWEHTLPSGQSFAVELSHQLQWPTEMILR